MAGDNGQNADGGGSQDSVDFGILALMQSDIAWKAWDVLKLEKGFRELSAVAQDVVGNAFCESDRGLVLVTAAIMDEELTEFLREHLKRQSDDTESEFEFFFTRRPMPPLGSTALKIRMARLLGIIDQGIAQSCLAIQDLRSKVAAHSRERMKLTNRHVSPISQHFSEAYRTSLREALRPFEATHLHSAFNINKLLFAMYGASVVDSFSVARKSFAAYESLGDNIHVRAILGDHKKG